MTTKQQIYMVDALCGSGKTHSAIQYAITLAAAGERVALIQPTLQLSDQSEIAFRKQAGNHRIKITQINSDGSNSVKESIKTHLHGTYDTGEILLITHSAWGLVCDDEWLNKEDWHLIIDEVPSIEKEFSRNVQDNHSVITDFISLGGPDPSGYAEIKPKAHFKTAVEQMALNRNKDEVSYIFRNLATWLVSPHWEVNVKASSYNKLLAGDGKKLVAFAVLNPSIVAGFKSVTIMGALFKDTPLYIIWSQMEVDFVPHPDIHGTRFQQHTNGSLITFRYMHDRNFSKSLDRQHQVIDKMAAAVLTDVGEGKLLWVANKDKPKNPFISMGSRQTQLSNAPHGMNNNQDVHNIAFLSALNNSPAHCKFLESLGFSSDALKRAIALQTTYQAMMRSSIRNPDDTDPKTVYVFDKEVADWSQVIFPGSSVEQMPGQQQLPKTKIGAPKKPEKTKEEKEADQRERTARCRENKKSKISR